MVSPPAVLLPVLALLAADPDAPAGAPPREAPASLETADDVRRLCAALEPAERLRAGGDALARADAEARHEAARDAAFERRFRVRVPGAALRFEAYDPGAGELALSDAAPLAGAGGAARLWAAEDAGLPVVADPATARRILAAQAAGRLALVLDFQLAEDAACGGGPHGRSFALAAEPLAWRYLDGDAPVAAGGEDGHRALSAEGKRPRVEVLAPVMGPPEASAAVRSRLGALVVCYVEALKRDPVLDGVLVARLGGEGGIAADSVGDPALASCVRREVARVGGHGAVPIRFELERAPAVSSAARPASE